MCQCTLLEPLKIYVLLRHCCRICVEEAQLPGQLFKLKDGTPLRKFKYISLVGLALVAQGVADKGYSGHSFQTGAASLVAMQGISDSNIKLLGRWESSAFLRYIKRLPAVNWLHLLVN